jgi:hypothetical protein
MSCGARIDLALESATNQTLLACNQPSLTGTVLAASRALLCPIPYTVNIKGHNITYMPVSKNSSRLPRHTQGSRQEGSSQRTNRNTMEHAVMALAGAFVLAFLVYKMICEKCIFFWYSNFKYKFLDSYLADFIYYGKDIGVDASLKLDKPSPAIYTRRLQGQAYLKSKLEYQAADASKGSRSSSSATRTQVRRRLSP